MKFKKYRILIVLCFFLISWLFYTTYTYAYFNSNISSSASIENTVLGDLVQISEQEIQLKGCSLTKIIKIENIYTISIPIQVLYQDQSYTYTISPGDYKEVNIELSHGKCREKVKGKIVIIGFNNYFSKDINVEYTEVEDLDLSKNETEDNMPLSNESPQDAETNQSNSQSGLKADNQYPDEVDAADTSEGGSETETETDVP
ncbi:hypothetical protein [Metabacillus indicus]|uniref:Uncharacterized protein n=1 Tax=Metabacillus indicus TaxID=246786 RepID=A0A084GWG6_METID|nr:hypothetical protein [Metabacillus indicus]KEZ51678.1 hypothetical protein GS18_0211170 [Metabacillus indicus]